MSEKRAEISKLTKLLLGCYRTGEANDPEVYTAAIIAVLSCYPVEIVRRAVDPRRGVPSRCKWLPTVAEVKEACEELMAPIYWQEERDAIEQQYRHSLPPPQDRSHRKTYQEIKADFAKAGIKIGDQHDLGDISAEAMKQKFGLSDADWDAIPNLPERMLDQANDKFRRK